MGHPLGPYAYPKWVVGTDKTLKADGRWPAQGSRLEVHIALGATDHTEVREVNPGKRIVLHAASSYLGPARVSIELEPSGDGTLVTMVEDPAGKLTPLRYVPPVQWLLRLRNVRGMRQLRELVEQRAAQPVG